MRIRHPFQFYGSEAFSGTENRKSNIIAKDTLIAPTAQEILKVRELWGGTVAEDQKKKKGEIYE